MKKIKIPDYISEAIYHLETKGFEAYIVGGAIRDILLGMEPTDWDITTNALTGDITSIFEKHIDTGIKHGTVTVIVKGMPIEITTYRIDGDYLDSRRPDKVTFTNELINDLQRRDFTINALAYNPKSGIVDMIGGLEDLKYGVIRCIGNPDARFKEDALRILRALRFGSVLNFEIETNTYDSINRNCELLKNISGERISSEITKILMADKHLERIFDTDVGNVILPEVARCFSVWQNNSAEIYDVGNHTLEVVYNTPKNPILRYAALFHDIGKVDTKEIDKWGFSQFKGHCAVSATLARDILTRLKASNKLKFTVVNLIRMHCINIIPTEVGVRRVVSKLGKAEFIDLISLKRADVLGQNPKYFKSKLSRLDKAEEIYYEVLSKKQPLFIKDLAVDGNDMRQLGLKSSDIGKKLHYLLSQVIENPELNSREKLLHIAKDSIKCKN